MVDEDHYAAPAHGWTCFHCGETFLSPGAARDHFGADQLQDPACRIKAGEEQGLVRALRRAENELERYRCEDSDADRAMAALRSDHAQALITEEEKGYARGLRDAGYQAEASPEDLRARGWTVAVHNDYRLDGVPHTFWLLTSGTRCVKGEARSDAVALNLCRAAIDKIDADDCLKAAELKQSNCPPTLEEALKARSEA
ncbi:hypothetical protein [Methylocapsa aurea]|uniref:hypothetical protein n=1 Tax=Methylocapsa aurea TaxID=663610 RepID=UPI003D18F26D